MSELTNQYADFLEKVKVGIHEASDITGVPSRKIRYWMEKRCIEATGGGSARQFNLVNIKKIMLIQELIEDGYSLDGATKKVDSRIEKLQKMFDIVLPLDKKIE